MQVLVDIAGSHMAEVAKSVEAMRPGKLWHM